MKSTGGREEPFLKTTCDKHCHNALPGEIPLQDMSTVSPPPQIQIRVAANTSTSPQPSVELTRESVRVEPEDGAECRLCFEAGEASLIAPCDCIGSMRWVHRSCLNQWRYHGQPTNQRAMTHCPTCAYEYKLYCNFDVNERQRHKRKYCCRLFRDTAIAFSVFQVMLCLLAIGIRMLDHDEWVLQLVTKAHRHMGHVRAHWWQDFFEHHLLLYYSAAVIIVFFLIGFVAILVYLTTCCCSASGPWCGIQQPRVAYGRRETCLNDCARSCICYDPGTVNDPCCCWGFDGFGSGGAGGGACVCEGEGALLCFVVVILVVILLGLFVALFMLSVTLQRHGQRYLRALHLKDIADRFAVVDRSQPTLSVSPAGAGEGPAVAPSIGTELSQEAIRELLWEEIRATGGHRMRAQGRDVIPNH